MGFYFSNKVDKELPYYRVLVTSESGVLFFGKHWERDSVIYVQDNSESYLRTLNKENKSWLDEPSNMYTVEHLNAQKSDKPEVFELVPQEPLELGTEPVEQEVDCLIDSLQEDVALISDLAADSEPVELEEDVIELEPEPVVPAAKSARGRTKKAGA